MALKEESGLSSVYLEERLRIKLNERGWTIRYALLLALEGDRNKRLNHVLDLSDPFNLPDSVLDHPMVKRMVKKIEHYAKEVYQLKNARRKIR